MATTAYDRLVGSARDAELGDLPRWSELSEGQQEHSLRVLRRLSVARALDSGDAFSTIETEAGLGEDAALRQFLLCTALLMAAESDEDPGERHPVGLALEEWVPARAADGLVARCWVYRDDEMLGWAPLHAVGSDFSRSDTDEYRRLTEARAQWDAGPRSIRLDAVGEAVTALLGDYARGIARPAGAGREVFPDAELRRSLRRAARGDSFSLLSDGAFANMSGALDIADGVEVRHDGDECYVRRTAFVERSFEAWSDSLAAWDPGGGAGETAFAWGAGLALVVSGGTAADWLGDCARACLSGRILATRRTG
jgi:hypothetical protein